MEISKIEEIESKIGYVFEDKEKLVQAFTTKSYAKELKDKGRFCESQESYRTLGDAILKMALIELLIKNKYSTPEQITTEKSKLERKENQAKIFLDFKIPFDYFQKAGTEPESIPLLAETFESLISSMFFDIGAKSKFENAYAGIRMYIFKWFQPYIVSISS
jgi:ribonuclease-3